MICFWTISCSRPQDNAYGSHLKLSFVRLDLEPIGESDCYDFVAIYTGIEAVPGNMVAKFCGSMLRPVCVSGFLPCSPISDILVPGLDATVEFRSDPATNGDGFELHWTLVLAPWDRPGSVGVFPQTISYFSGGTVSLAGSTVAVHSCLFNQNFVFDTFFASGGALVARGGMVDIRNSSFLANKVSGIFASGGAVSVVGGAENSNFGLTDCEMERNSATASGPWFFFSCPFFLNAPSQHSWNCRSCFPMPCKFWWVSCCCRELFRCYQ